MEGAVIMTQEPTTPNERPKKSEVREWLETLVIALLLAVGIRFFIIQQYVVEGISMEPNLHTGERLLVNKLIYRLRPPVPGEVIVLQDPKNPRRELVKRIIALQGETVSVRQNVVYINDKPLDEPFKNTEVLPYADFAPFTVPVGSVFVMGDNRGVSADSRVMGPVNISNIDGKAFFTIWPASSFGAGPQAYPRVYLPAGVVK
jgi:signal peptidase I